MLAAKLRHLVSWPPHCGTPSIFFLFFWLLIHFFFYFLGVCVSVCFLPQRVAADFYRFSIGMESFPRIFFYVSRLLHLFFFKTTSSWAFRILFGSLRIHRHYGKCVDLVVTDFFLYKRKGLNGSERVLPGFLLCFFWFQPRSQIGSNKVHYGPLGFDTS